MDLDDGLSVVHIILYGFGLYAFMSDLRLWYIARPRRVDCDQLPKTSATVEEDVTHMPRRLRNPYPQSGSHFTLGIDLSIIILFSTQRKCQNPVVINWFATLLCSLCKKESPMANGV